MHASGVVRSIDEIPEFSLEDIVWCIQHFAPGHDHQVVTAYWFVMPKELTGQAPCPIPDDRRPKLAGGGDAQSGVRPAVGVDEEQHQAAGVPGALLVNLLVFFALPDVFDRAESRHLYRSSDTVRRFRPFARLRFSTWRPSLVDIRTRKPWVLTRWRLFG
jgi:hypothetical protein